MIVSTSPSTSVGAASPSGVAAASSSTASVPEDTSGRSFRGVTAMVATVLELAMPSFTMTLISRLAASGLSLVLLKATCRKAS